MLIKIKDKKQKECEKALSQNSVDEWSFMHAYHANTRWFSQSLKQKLPTRLDFELFHEFNRGVKLRDLEKQYKIPRIQILRSAMIVMRALQGSGQY